MFVQEDFPDQSVVRDRYLQFCDKDIRVFSHPRDNIYHRPCFLEKDNFGPLHAKDRVRYRQEVARALKDDIAGPKDLHKHFDALQFIIEWTTRQREHEATP